MYASLHGQGDLIAIAREYSPTVEDTAPGTVAFADREVPMHRLGRPEEVADAIRFLCSPQASYVNGAELHINGGQHV